jgi:outer membrane protein TolC
MKRFMTGRLLLTVSSSAAVAVGFQTPCSAQPAQVALQTPPAILEILPHDSVLKLAELMSAASENYGTVRASEAQIKATTNNAVAVALNSLSLSGAISSSKEADSINNTVTGATLDRPAGIVGSSSTLGVRLLLSLTTWFQARGILITKQIQESALQAMKMQLATNAAQAYVSYSINDLRMKYLSLYLKRFMQIQGGLEQAPAQAPHGGGNNGGEDDLAGMMGENLKTQISTKIAAIQESIRQAQLQKWQARDTMLMYLGKPYVQAIDKEVDLTDTKSLGDIVNAKAAKLDLDYINSLFPVPATYEEAVALAQKSPALIQADLNVKAAQNQWYLTLASMGPFVSFSFSENMQKVDQSYDPTPKTFSNVIKRTDGGVFVASVGINLGAGVFNSLRSNQLLEEASVDNREATQDQIKTQIGQLYDSLFSIVEEMKLNDQIVQQSVPIIMQAQIPQGRHLQEFIQLFNNLDEASEKLSEEFMAYINTRLQIHDMTGTLLFELKRMESTPQQ